jgi:NADPH-dependent glutamate synthase beta subunit-like oxidoreductase
MDIPAMLRQIAAGDLHAAIATIKRDIALPAVLGRICPAPCEKICRRGQLDQPVSICLLKRFAADADFVSSKPYDPPCSAASGKHVAIVGAGPTGLAAVYYLRQHGHACTIFDEKELPGGRLCDLPEKDLPREVLNLEIATIMRLGLTLQMGIRQDFAKLADFQKQFDAVLLACGATAREQAIQAKMPVSQRGLEADLQTYATPLGKKIFAAGNAVRSKAMVVRSVADGKEAAYAIHQFLSGQKVTGWPRAFNTKIGRMSGEELTRFAADSHSGPRRDPAEGLSAGYSLQEGQEQASRCMHCDCRGVQTCKLREYATRYDADPHHFAVRRRLFESDAQHPEVVYESGKCIACGLCIQIAAAAGEPLGLTYVGRGFDVRVSAPFHQSIAQALTQAAADCVAACPTGALAFKNKPA